MSDRAVAVVFAVTVAAAIFVYYLLARLIPFFDALRLFSPYFSLVADYARAGQLLLWNPYINCGSPDLAYVEMGSFSPLTLALALATGGGQTGFLIYWLASWAIFGAGACLFALHLGAPRPAAMAVAASLMFGGFFLGNGSHTSWVYGFSFLPLILWRLDLTLTGRGWWPAVEAGALYGLSALAGHPALVILNGMYVGLWAAGRVFFSAETSPGEERNRRQRLLVVALALGVLLAVGLVILSPAYLAFWYESAGYSDRAGYLDRSLAIGNQALTPAALATMASPYLSSVDFANNIWPRTFPLLTCCYAGAIVPVLALAGIAGRRDGFRWWIAAVGLFFLAAAVGDALPVRGWLYDYFPPTRFFRHSAVMRAHFLFSLGVLAMLGARDLVGVGPAAARIWKRVGIFAVALLPLVAGIFLFTLFRGSYRVGLYVAVAQMAVAWVGLAAVAAAGWAAADKNRTGMATGALRLLVGLALVDGGFSIYIARDIMMIGRSDYEAMMTRRDPEIDLMSRGLYRARLPLDETLVDFNFYDKIPLLEGFNQLSHRFHSSSSLTLLPTCWSQERPLYEAVIGRRSRIWFSPLAPPVFPSDATFMALVERARQLDTIPLVVHRPEEILQTPPRDVPGPNDDAEADAISRLPACRRVEVELLDYTPTRLAFKVNTREAGWLLVTDRWSRSWRAQVNGRDAVVWGGDFLFRAVQVGAGPQTVEFDFHPFLHPLLFYLSWGLMLMVVTVSFYRWKYSAGD